MSNHNGTNNATNDHQPKPRKKHTRKRSFSQSDVDRSVVAPPTKRPKQRILANKAVETQQTVNKGTTTVQTTDSSQLAATTVPAEATDHGVYVDDSLQPLLEEVDQPSSPASTVITSDKRQTLAEDPLQDHAGEQEDIEEGEQTSGPPYDDGAADPHTEFAGLTHETAEYNENSRETRAALKLPDFLVNEYGSYITDEDVLDWIYGSHDAVETDLDKAGDCTWSDGAESNQGGDDGTDEYDEEDDDDDELWNSNSCAQPWAISHDSELHRLESLPVAQLRDVALAAGIHVSNKSSKAQMIYACKNRLSFVGNTGTARIDLLLELQVIFQDDTQAEEIVGALRLLGETIDAYNCHKGKESRLNTVLAQGRVVLNALRALHAQTTRSLVLSRLQQLILELHRLLMKADERKQIDKGLLWYALRTKSVLNTFDL